MGTTFLKTLNFISLKQFTLSKAELKFKFPEFLTHNLVDFKISHTHKLNIPSRIREEASDVIKM